ncbi:MAG: aminopeptidase [Methanobacteriota archaeon]|nr:aminopeptidase [Acidimicrobiaceae bacterium]RAH06007.1 MAG: aminopeptidase [Euryarchaeota archaeon]
MTILPDEDLPFDSSMLDRLAEVSIRVGLNLQPEQDLIISAPVEALPLVRRLAAEAYRNGAGVVTTLLSDDQLTLARFENASDESLDRAPSWMFEAIGAAFNDNTARLAVSAANPLLLADQDPARVARAAKATSLAAKPAMEPITNFSTNWNIVSYPGAAWAKQVFPDKDEADAVASLAKAIFSISRVDCDDPISAWADHQLTLTERQEWLNEKSFHSLHYKAPGTDFVLGLADGHEWKGGSSTSLNGISCTPNIPTEEVFTTPHAHRAEGTVRATKPLVHMGTLIEGIEVRFEGGKIVEASAEVGEEVFLELIATDEGASRLGEVALVPHSSPISESGLLFYNTLYDENASCHIALGQCYSKCFKGGIGNDKDAVAEAGGNSSNIHVDWMIGSAELDIDGISEDGKRTPVMRSGEWAFET